MRCVRCARTVAIAIAGAALIPSQAIAAAACSFSVTGPAFGLYNPLNAAPTLANGVVTATCTWISGGASNITLVSAYTAGNSGNFVTRYMQSGTNRLNYNLYFESTFGSIRGDGTGGSQTGIATLRVSRGQPTDSTTSVIYGRIPALQNANPGTYADAILVTITY